MSITATSTSSSSTETFSQFIPYIMFTFELPDVSAIDIYCSALLDIYGIKCYRSIFEIADCHATLYLLDFIAKDSALAKRWQQSRAPIAQI